jgi:microcystin degradation protein MlrC
MIIFSATLATETNTFGPLPTGLQAFKERGYYPAGTHPDEMQFFAGPLWAARQRAKGKDWTLKEGLVAGAMPSGITTRHAYETLRDEILADLRQALPVDIVLLGLHGAMVADGYVDCEGDLITRVREIVGPNVVVGVELDPHCHLSKAKTDGADVVVLYKEYPHTDVLDRAYELVDLCVAKHEGRIHPTHAVFDCNQIAMMHTSRDPMRGFVDRIQAMEGRDGVLSISVAHGFPWGDTPDMGTRVLVYTESNQQQAAELAQRLGKEIIAFRDQLNPGYPGVDEALDQALAHGEGPVVLADSADNAGGGAPSDSTFILRRALERGIRDIAIGPLWDPVAVQICFEAGEGARLALRVGGKIAPVSGQPVDATWTVRKLRRNAAMTGLSKTVAPMGDSALIESNGVFVVLNSTRTQAFDVDLFTQFGLEPGQIKIMVVKSSQHFYASFSKIAKKIIYVESPGTVTQDLKSLPFKKIKLPKWPF